MIIQILGKSKLSAPCSWTSRKRTKAGRQAKGSCCCCCCYRCSLHTTNRPLLNKLVTHMLKQVEQSAETAPPPMHVWTHLDYSFFFFFFASLCITGWRMPPLSNSPSLAQFFKLGLQLIWTRNSCHMTRLLFGFMSEDTHSQLATFKTCVCQDVGTRIVFVHRPNHATDF